MISEIAGIRIIKTDNGNNLSIISGFCPILSRTIPFNVTFIAAPVLSEKLMKLPLISTNDKRIIREKYIDCIR